MLCHSVRACQLPSLSLKRSLVARLNLATGVPCGVNFTSGSLPRLPMRMTLLTLFPAMGCSFAGDHYSRIGGVEMVRTVTIYSWKSVLGQTPCRPCWEFGTKVLSARRQVTL